MSDEEMGDDMGEEMADDAADAGAAADAVADEEAGDDAAAETADEAAPVAEEAAEEAETPEPAADDEPEAAPVVTTTPGVIEAQELEGELPLQDDKHFLGLEPSERNGTMDLVMAFDPRDNSQLATRVGFWVLDQDAFNRYLNPNENVVLSQVAIAAGSGDQPGLASNEFSASITASDFGPYTVVPYNNSTVPAEYSLRVDGGVDRRFRPDHDGDEEHG